MEIVYWWIVVGVILVIGTILGGWNSRNGGY
jgi:hypothetical protein